MNTAIRVIVAEDLVDTRECLVTLLQGAGFAVLAAHDGRRALELIENTDGLDLVVTDINIPGFSGVEVAEHARAKDPAIPVILVTGKTDLAAYHGIGQPVRCIPKPISATLLLETVNDLLQRALS